jgi:hypothetical protein
MSSDNQIQKRSLKDRVKPHLPVAAISFSAGAIIAIVLTRGSSTINVTIPVVDEGVISLGENVIKSIKEHGSAMIEIEPGRLVDLIDWSHPSNADK